MKASRLLFVAVMVGVGVTLLSVRNASASHLFSQGGQQGVTLTAGFGVDITSSVLFSSSPAGVVSLYLYFDIDTPVGGTDAARWSAGDALRIKIGSNDLDLFYDTPLVGMSNGPTLLSMPSSTNPGLVALIDDQLSGFMPLRIEALAGSFKLDGFHFFDQLGGTANRIQGQGSIPGQVTANTAVPEPSTLLLLGTGLVGLAAYRRKRRA